MKLDLRIHDSTTPIRLAVSRARPWLSVIGALCLSAHAASPPGYFIDGFTAAGGGTSVGGTFSLSGSIGQPDAGAPPMTGGGFSLTGGFWSVFAVRMPDAPLLSIELLSATSARVSWPSPSPGFVLQQNARLSASNWVNVSRTVSDNGANRFITLTPSDGRHFYRLFKP